MKINITKYLDYRQIVREKSAELKISFRQLANSAGIHTSYFSRVMVGSAHFSQEQLYKISHDLGLRTWETEYLQLLGDLDRSGSQEHKNFLNQKIQGLREERQKVFSEVSGVEVYKQKAKALAREREEELAREREEELRIEKYYEDPLTQKVHLYLTIEKFREKPSLIAPRLGITDKRLEKEITKLEEVEIVQRTAKGEIKGVKFNIHLDQNHPLIPQTHINWRLEAIRKIQSREKQPSDFHFSVCFSTDEAAKVQIKELFKQFIIEAQKEASQHRANEEVFSICFDLF